MIGEAGWREGLHAAAGRNQPEPKALVHVDLPALSSTDWEVHSLHPAAALRRWNCPALPTLQQGSIEEGL